jgi:carbonic anhydrase/acetyltransferase-like protein (isoleucine patch superfamily)
MLEILSTLNAIVKNHEETERRHVQCGPFSKQQKTLKCSSLEKMESAVAAWFKQARKYNASIDGTHLKEKA